MIRGVHASALATGADVLACLSPHARVMTGIGDRLGPLITLPKMFVVLVNPRVQAPTPKVFAALGLAPGSSLAFVRPTVRRGRTGCERRSWIFLPLAETIWKRRRSSIAPAIAVVRDKLARIPGDRGDRNVWIGSDLLCLVRRSPQCDDSAAHSRSGTSGLVDRGDRHPLDWIG